MVLRFQGFRVLGFLGFRVLGFLGFQLLCAYVCNMCKYVVIILDCKLILSFFFQMQQFRTKLHVLIPVFVSF